MKRFPVFPGATGGVMLPTNMELRALLVQLAMLEAAETISATKVLSTVSCYPLSYAVQMCLVCLNNTWNKWKKYIYYMLADGSVDRHTAPETEDTNHIEPESARDRDHRPRAQNPNTTPSDNPGRYQFVSTEQMSMDQTIRSPFECVHGSEYFIHPHGKFCDGVCGFRSAGPL